MANQKALEFKQYTPKEVHEQGLPIFNDCNHYVVDMSHLHYTKKDWMNTIVVKLPNGNVVTLCVMQVSDGQTCIDSSFHGDNIAEHRVLTMGEREGFNKEKPNYNRNIYALIADVKEVQKKEEV